MRYLKLVLFLLLWLSTIGATRNIVWMHQADGVAFCTSSTAPPSLVCEDAEGSITVQTDGDDFDTAWQAWTPNVSATATLFEAAHTNAGWCASNQGSYAIRMFLENGDEEASLATTFGTEQKEVYIEVCIDMVTVTLSASRYVGVVLANELGGNSLFGVSILEDVDDHIHVWAKWGTEAAGTDSDTGTTNFGQDNPFCLQIHYLDHADDESDLLEIKSDDGCDGTYETTEITTSDLIDDSGIKVLFYGSEQTTGGFDNSYLSAGDSVTYEMDLLGVDTSAPGVCQ